VGKTLKYDFNTCKTCIIGTIKIFLVETIYIDECLFKEASIKSLKPNKFFSLLHFP